MEEDFKKIRAISEEYSKKLKEWEEAHLKSSFRDAMKAQISLFEEFDKKLEELDLSTPQGEYALCKIRGAIAHYNRGSHDYAVKETRPITYEEFLHERMPNIKVYEESQAYRLRVIDDAVNSNVYKAKFLSDKQATEKLNNECFQSAARYPHQDTAIDEISTPGFAGSNQTNRSRYS